MRWAGPSRARKVVAEGPSNMHGNSCEPPQYQHQHPVSQSHAQAQQSVQQQQQQQQRQHACQMACSQEQQHQQSVAGAGRPGEKAVKGHELKCSWRVKLKECVDAAPTVLISGCQGLQQQQQHLTQQPSQLYTLDSPSWQLQQTEYQQAGQHALQQHQHRQAPQQARQQHWVFACSHGGDVVCVEGRSGGVVWEGQVEGRAEAGLTISPDCRVSLHLPALLARDTLLFTTKNDAQQDLH